MFPLTISMEAMQIPALALIAGSISICGSAVASTGSIRAMLAFAAKNGTKPQIEKFALTQAGVTEAMQKLRDGEMRYRGVLVAP